MNLYEGRLFCQNANVCPDAAGNVVGCCFWCYSSEEGKRYLSNFTSPSVQTVIQMIMNKTPKPRPTNLFHLHSPVVPSACCSQHLLLQHSFWIAEEQFLSTTQYLQLPGVHFLSNFFPGFSVRNWFDIFVWVSSWNFGSFVSKTRAPCSSLFWAASLQILHNISNFGHGLLLKVYEIHSSFATSLTCAGPSAYQWRRIHLGAYIQ